MITTKAQSIAKLKSGILKVESAAVSDARIIVFGDTATVHVELTMVPDHGQGRHNSPYISRIRAAFLAGSGSNWQRKRRIAPRTIS